MPWFFRLATIDRARSMSANSELSVTSTTSRSAGKPVSDSKRTIFCASQLSVNWPGEILIEIFSAGSHSTAAASALRDHLVRQSADQIMFLGDRDEAVGRDDPAERMLPARQHFETDDRPGRKIDLRFEIGNELVMLEAEADALLDLAVGDQFALHTSVEPHRPADAAAARMIHGDVGAAQQVGNSDSGNLASGNAKEGTDLDELALFLDRARDLPQQRIAKGTDRGLVE